MNGTIAISASLAQKPLQGGHAWVLLQYLLGFKGLGWDVLFIDSLEPDMCFDRRGRPCRFGDSLNLESFTRVMNTFGLDDAYSLMFDGGNEYAGLSRREVLKKVGDAVLLLNFMGFLNDEEILGRAPKRVFFDIDPGFGQMWEALGLARMYQGYDSYVSIGENIGRKDCGIPTCGLTWITTPQPVVLEHWPPVVGKINSTMTSVASWRGAYGPVEYRGRTFGLRAHEFRRLASLPRDTSQDFELALGIHPSDAEDRNLLTENGWRLVDPVQVAGDPCSYRAYIQRSASEFMVAKNMYVDTNSGWFSDRSICYLSSAKPVLALDTGLKSLLPTGEGLLLFTSLEEAVEGVEALRAEYGRHARAARAIAEEHFDSVKVLGRLLTRLGIG